jgi:signal transduction histidine kinase/Fe-S-cluster-containing hydrogenase component 2
MKHLVDIPLVKTIKEKCRVCYTCVRECPAKAIRIADGQAEVLPERCIGCGNCVRVCSQHAKAILDSIDRVEELLAGPAKVAACLAPSFPAEFADRDPEVLVGMIRELGFALVTEVAFGADLVAEEYRKLLARTNGERFVATSCPAIVSFVERYYPALLPRLAPIVSPMIAMARVLHRLHGEGLRVVFVGPCLAKKGEAASELVRGEVDAVLTFAELREMFTRASLTPVAAAASDFDPPHPGAGALFPITGGLLQAAGIQEDLLAGEVITADGRTGFVEAVKEFDSGDMEAKLLEVLCCNGCIMGAGMSSQEPLFGRRSRVSKYVRRRMAQVDPAERARVVASLEGLDLSRQFTSRDQRIPVPFGEEIRQILERMGKTTAEDELNCGACGYDTCREHATAIFKGLAESEMCLPNTIEKLRNTIQELAVSNGQLASAQEALMQSEKLASMGQLAAGIAHEVNNPLGVVLMYAHLLLEEYTHDPRMREDLELIVDQADRCKKIVAGLLHFARQNKVVAQETDVYELVGKAFKALPIPDDVRLTIQRRTEDVTAEVDADQLPQVLTNLVSNACAAMSGGGDLTVAVGGDEHTVYLEVTDTGCGIPEENRKKIFEPFFTTKQMGKGTGLGLAVTYGIVKMHSGDIKVVSNADPLAGPTGTTFTVTLPRRRQQE